jgi:cell wall assembly regulator SMI1
MRLAIFGVLICLPIALFLSRSCLGWNDVGNDEEIRVFSEATDLWRQLEDAMKQHSPHALAGLNAAATDDALRSLEVETGLSLPGGLRAVLKIRNGGAETDIFGEGFDFLSAEEMAKHWRMHIAVLAELPFAARTGEFDPEFMAHCDRGVRPLIANRKWLPFADSNGDITRYIDFDPAPDGQFGQIIEVDPEGTEWRVLARGFEEFLAYQVRMKAGE